MSNLVGIKTTDLKNIFDTFNNDSFSKNLTKGKMMKAKNLIDNNYLKMNSINDLLGIN
jgi:YesN/AraC family two-component response regulator